jgi:hypothetical protein
MDIAWTENTALHEAYHASREETAALKAAMDALMKRTDKTITTTAPPSLDTITSSTMIEEMIIQLSYCHTLKCVIIDWVTCIT